MKESVKMLELKFSTPLDIDGREMWNLAKKSNVLDLNSPYSYLMMAKFFKETCIIAKHDDKLVGFVTAFILPDRPNTVFVWQIGVSKEYHGQGIGTKLLSNLLESRSCKDINYLAATISPTNKASQSLFNGLAKHKNTNCDISECFPENWFPEGNHEPELIYTIGPFLT